MGREAYSLQLLCGPLGDAGGTTTASAGRGQGYRDNGIHQLTEGGGAGPDSVLVGLNCVGDHRTGGCINPEGGQRLWVDLDCRGFVEHGDGGNEPPPWNGYHPAQCPARIQFRSWDKYCLPLGQTASAANIREGGGTLYDISGPAQGV